MDVSIKPSVLSGKIKAISSKSIAHRMLICAALSDGESLIEIDNSSEDIEATISALENLGAEIEKNQNTYKVKPVKEITSAILDCGESGSTLRFLVPVCASLGVKTVFCGRGRLPQRPMDTLTDVLEKHSVKVNKGFPLEIEGKLSKGRYVIDGSVSSQFITGLLLALPQAGGGEIEITGNFQSKSYVDITVSVMEKFGVKVEEKENLYIVPDKKFTCANLVAEGDWSNGAFFLTAGVTVENLDINSKQGDRKILEVLKTLQKEDEEIFIDVSDIPDLVPIISVRASVRKGKTNIINAERLKLKESDRIFSTVSMINSLGGQAEGTDNSIIIYGKEKLKGGTVDSFNDHRIAMSLTVLSSVFGGKIENAECVNKSYPLFFKDCEQLGIKFNF